MRPEKFSGYLIKHFYLINRIYSSVDDKRGSNNGKEKWVVILVIIGNDKHMRNLEKEREGTYGFCLAYVIRENRTLFK